MLGWVEIDFWVINLLHLARNPQMNSSNHSIRALIFLHNLNKKKFPNQMDSPADKQFTGKRTIF